MKINVIYFSKHKKDIIKLIKLKRRKYEEEIMNKLENLYHENPDEFWKFLKSFKHNENNEELPSSENLIDHFKKLYTTDKTY